MDCYSLNVFERDSGTVWQNKTRTGLGTAEKAILSVSNKCHCYESNSCKGARFVQIAVDSVGKRLAAGDRHGHVYLFHLELNRFWLVSKLGSCSTALAFTPLDERDLLLATADCSLHVFETGERRHVTHLSGHPTCVSHISVDRDGRRFLTCSLKTALVWDLLTLTILHQLNFHLEENLVKSLFVPPGMTFLTALKEERILVWNSTTFEFSHQLRTIPDSAIRVLDVSSDGHLLAAGGRTSWLLIWRLWDSLGEEEEEEPTVLSMGAAGVPSVRHLAFMPPTPNHADPRQSTHVLGVVSHEGILHFYEVETQSHLLRMDLSLDSITSFRAAAYHSWKYAVLTFSGKVLLYDLELTMASRGVATSKHIEEPVENIQDRKAAASVEREELLQHSYDSSKNVTLSDATVSQLKGIVKEYGHYPDKYRFLIWRSLLSLPNNEVAFKKLSSQPQLNVFPMLHRSYPLSNTTVYRALQRILSVLCRWCPRLSEIPDLPLLVFPFVKLFHQNLHLCFELLVAFICNWCQNWWMYYPSAPFRVLTAAESLLSYHDPMLLLHFIRHGITAEVYVWSLLKSVFSEVISKEVWMNLFDHVLSNRPSFLLYVVVAFNILSRKAPMSLSDPADIRSFFRHQQPSVSDRELVKKAYLLRQRTPANIRETCGQAVGPFSPVQTPGEVYPTFTNFPSLGINGMEEHRRAQERVDYIKSRQNKLLNMQATENVRLCRCTPDIPANIRRDTCACVRQPPGSSVHRMLSPSHSKENINPGEKRHLPRRSPVWKEPQSILADLPPHGDPERCPSRTSTDVIRRVMETRKRISQQVQSEM